jgi:trehalose 6-phosphate synthase/phosphatase
LATGLRTVQKTGHPVLVGWPGLWPSDEKEKKHIEEVLVHDHQCHPVFLSPSEMEKYYYGFSNKTIWPLFHYFSTYCSFEESEWRSYIQVNQKFLDKVCRIAGPRDTFWVHDYHLMLLPALIRKSFPRSSIGFFLHIPFPSSEIFRILPWRKEILKGILGSDLIGFHTYEYARHFLSAVLRLLGHEHDFGSITWDNRRIKVGNFPMGIDFRDFEKKLEESSIQKEMKKLRKSTASEQRKIILSVDRLDYTKGIPQRLKGFEYFLETRPQWHGRFIYIMLSVPSRSRVSHYAQLKEEVESLVGKINGRFGRPGWIPVHYMYRSLPFHRLLPLYSVADVALVTPHRDGMNLVAKEYVASQKDNLGVLVLSETAGASTELGEALLINVNNKTDVAAAISQALEMDEKEQKARMRTMRRRTLEYDIFKWTRSFIMDLEETKKLQALYEHRKLNQKWQGRLLSDYKKSRRRLLLLDYDGTLISYAMKPENAEPDTELVRLLLSLTKPPENKLVIISGRDRSIMSHWLKKIPCSLVAEHGAWIKPSPKGKWEKQTHSSDEWKEEIRQVLKTYEIRVPGSVVEEKEFGMAWHYRRANPELGLIRSNELFDYLSEFLANTDLQVMHGNKVIEVRVGGVNKGEASKHFLTLRKWDFVLAMGDDWTDEDIFKTVPSSAYSIKVGYKPTHAHFYIESTRECRSLLRKLSKTRK